MILRMRKRSSLSPREIQCLKTFGARVRAARASKGWTLEEAEARGWNSWQHLQQIESGGKNINFTTLLRLLRLLELDPTRTLGDLKP